MIQELQRFWAVRRLLSLLIVTLPDAQRTGVSLLQLVGESRAQVLNIKETEW
jgi:hypothetical protein